MKRGEFIKHLALLPLIGSSMKLSAFEKLTSGFEKTAQMPVMFLGHGSPMNAIQDNEFVRGFKKIIEQVETPKAILCISAHWETKGTFVTAMEQPRTIHDFGGFPKELFDVQYPASGSPEIAKLTQEIVTKTHIEFDHEWGLDHGAWSVIKHLYPKANIPVIQLSIDYTKPAEYHYALAQELQQLRNKGVLIIGSGNMVHNLRMVAWDKIEDNFAFDWALEASDSMKNWILNGNHQELIDFKKQGRAFNLAIPTPEHYLPLLYVLGNQGKSKNIQLFNDEPVAGSLTMTSVFIS